MSDYEEPKEPELDYVEVPADSFWDGVGVGIIIVIVIEVVIVCFCHLAGYPVFIMQ